MSKLEILNIIKEINALLQKLYEIIKEVHIDAGE